MAGSFKHVINEKGEFIGIDLIDNLGDAHEALEEMYYMIEYLSEGKEDIFESYLHAIEKLGGRVEYVKKKGPESYLPERFHERFGNEAT